MLDLGRRSDKSDIAKRREKAEKYLQKGKVTAALEEYVAILHEDPENDTIRQTAADLYIQVNDTHQAAKLLGDLFTRQVDAGDSTNAALTYKKLTRFAKPTFEQTFRYAQFIEANNKKEALEAYEVALAGFTAQRNNKRALAVLERIVFLDPSGQNFWRAGELALELGEGKKAGVCFLSVGELEQKSGGNAAPWYERAFRADRNNPEAALAYGRMLVQQNSFLEALQVLQPLMKDGAKARSEVRELYGRALVGTGRLTEAEPVLWALFEQNPERAQQIVDLVAAEMDAQQDAAAVALARKLEKFLRGKGSRREFVGMLSQLLEQHRPSVEMLEYMAELFNGSNREADYCQTLIKLFDLYYAAGNFAKAGDALDRAAEVDAYEPGHHSRLEMLRGKIEEQRLNAIAGRFTIVTKTTETQQQEEEADEHSMLQDLMLQAEILVQYGMRNKALERLQRIQQLFPHEEERNSELRQLYIAAGLAPQGSGISSPAPASPEAHAPTPPPHAPEAVDVSGFAKVSDITRKLNRQNTPEAVLEVTANEVGAQWRLGRCVVAARKPGVAAATTKEFSGTGSPAAADILQQLVCGLHDLAVGRGALNYADTNAIPELQPFVAQISKLEARSLVVLPLTDGSDHLGVLLIMQSTPRNWSANDVLVFKMIAEQVGIALNNVGLRRLVKNLSVTDETSGLLRRASYLDLLLGEVGRASQQNSPLSVLLMRFSDNAALAKEQGEAAVETVMQRLGQIVAANIRQNDLAFRYAADAIAIILGETEGDEGLLVVEKMRRLITSALGDKQMANSFNAGVAQAVIKQQFDEVDIVTELINRAEQALEKSLAEGAGKSVALEPALAAAAVA